MQPVTQNRKYPKGLNHVSCVIWSCIVACNLLHEIGNAGKGLNNVPCVVRSCNKLHATRESRITYRGWFIRATSCTLHSKWITLLTVDDTLSEMHEKITALYFIPWLIWLCIKMHATRKMNNAQYVDWKNISKDHRAFFIYRMSLWGEWWVEIALIAQTAILQTKKSKVINLALVIWWR